MSDYEKPPLGCMLRYLWVEIRIKDLLSAISRYTDVGKYDENIDKWVDELCIRVKEMKDLQK